MGSNGRVALERYSKESKAVFDGDNVVRLGHSHHLFAKEGKGETCTKKVGIEIYLLIMSLNVNRNIESRDFVLFFINK